MNIVYVFIGPLPEYSVTTVHQARLFYDGPIYFIVSDMMSPFVITLKEKYNVTIVPYDFVKDVEFNNIVQKNYRRFNIISYLKGREKLFIYAFERFFCLKQLMLRENLTDILFLELDNLIYDDCKYLEIYLLENIRKDIRDHEWCDPKVGSYVSPLKTKKGEWALFYNDGINLFVQNNSSNSIKLTYYTAHKKVQYELNSNNYILLKIYEENSFGVFVLKFNDEMIATLDLNPENERKFWIESTNFTKF